MNFKKKNKFDLIVVVPFYNEGENLVNTYKEWSEVLTKLNINFHFYLINDGSTDDTVSFFYRNTKSHKKNFLIINKQNSGHGNSCIFGYLKAIDGDSEWVLQIDSDGQCDPYFFDIFWSSKDKNKFIFGKRRLRKDGFIRLVLTKLLSFYILLSKFEIIYDANVPYRLMKTEFLKKLNIKELKIYYLSNIFLSILIKKNGFKISWVNIVFRDRMQGSSMFNFKNIIRLGFKTLKEITYYNKI